MRHESLGCEHRIVQIATRHAGAADAQFAAHARRCETARAIEDPRVHAGDRRSDGHIARNIKVVHDAADRRFRRTVLVHHPHTGRELLEDPQMRCRHGFPPDDRAAHGRLLDAQRLEHQHVRRRQLDRIDTRGGIELPP